MDSVYHDCKLYVFVENVLRDLRPRKRNAILRQIQGNDANYIYVSKNQSGYKVLDKATRYKLKKMCISKECIDRYSNMIDTHASRPTNSNNTCSIDVSQVKKDQTAPREKTYKTMCINIEGTEYYNINFVKEKNPYISRGCRTFGEIISKNNIPHKSYVYVSYSKIKSKYTILPADTTYKLKKLFLHVDWVHQNVLDTRASRATNTNNECSGDLLQVKRDQTLLHEKTNYVYLVTSPSILLVKVGIWSRLICQLASRYTTVYGPDIKLLVFDVPTTKEKEKIEQDFIHHFQSKRVAGELFDKDAYHEYTSFLHQTTGCDSVIEWNKKDALCFKRKKCWDTQLTLLPPIVELDADKSFIFENKYYSIKIRGSRYFDTTFFSMRDLGNLFGIKKIRNILCSYHRGVDYVYFLNQDGHGCSDNKSPTNAVTYFTTHGLFKFLGRMKKRSTIHEAFISWVSQTLLVS